MAQTGYTPIKLYYSTTPSVAPAAGDLSYGELAINITDGKLYFKDNLNNVKLIATNSTASLTLPISATNGGTGLSSYTTGDMLYASGTSTFARLPIGTTNYVITSNGSAPQYVAQNTLSVNSAANILAGSAGALPYNSGAGTTTFLSLGVSGYILTAGASGPEWTAPGSISSNTANNLAGGTTGAVPYQSGVGATTFLSLGTTNQVMTAGATGPQYVDQSTLSVGSASTATTATTATNLAGGSNGSLPYQTGSGSTTFLSPGSNGQVLTLAGGVPTWAASTGGVTSFSAGTTGLTPSSATTGAITLAGTLGVANGGTGLTSLTAGRIPYGNGTSAFSNSANLAYDGTTLVVGPSILAGTINPIIAATGSLNNYIQSYIYNSNTGISASADFVAYANNSSDLHGWADLGFTSSNYADTVYTVTGPNEAYLFGSALNNTYTGNLVYATDSTGSANSHQWYVGGFTQAKSAWKMQLTTAGLQLANALSIANGGTGQTTASAAFNALSPIAVTGDLIIGNGTNSATRLPIGANTYVLTSNGTTATWAAPTGGGGAGSTSRTVTDFTATNGQTSFTVAYTIGLLDVYRNGVKLAAADVTATNGTSFTIAACTTGDIVQAVAFSALSIAASITSDLFSGNGSTTVFTMSASPTNASSALVAISGVVQAPSTYTVSGTTLTFSDPPPTGTNNISVRYLGIASAGTGLSITDDNSTNATRYLISTGTTSGSITTGTVSSAEFFVNPGTNILTAPVVNSSYGFSMNPATLSTSFTIPADHNAVSAGPITIATSVTITVSTGSAWTIV